MQEKPWKSVGKSEQRLDAVEKAAGIIASIALWLLHLLLLKGL